MKKIAIITARAGSKGLPNKNVLLVDGKPLISYSIEAALASREFDKIIVSTDSQEYIDLLSGYPIEFIKRAAHLASDKASSFVVIEDVLQQYHNVEFDYFVLLQPTSPLRTAIHIQQACEKFEQNMDRFDFLVSVSDAHKPTTLTRIIEADESLKHFQLDYSNYARQQCHPEYSPNGAIFIAKPSAYLTQKHFYGEKCLAYFMDKSVSIDIDDSQDFEYFQFIIQQRNKAKLQLAQIQLQILAKKESFLQIQPVTFIGHSILSQWNISSLNGKPINNLAISGIATAEYWSEIIQQNLLQHLGQIVVVMLGVNDLTRKNKTQIEICDDIENLISYLRKISPTSQIYFLEIIPTAFRIERDNQKILELNALLKQRLTGINWVNLFEHFCDKYGKLDLMLSDDGLHLNLKGYEKLQLILETLMA